MGEGKCLGSGSLSLVQSIDFQLMRMRSIIIFSYTQEEEEFANFLNHEFCLGLSEVANGTTKRAFLSSKLSCTKMRISKKFKGECWCVVLVCL